MMQNIVKHVNCVFSVFEGVKSVLSKFTNSIEEKNEFLTSWSNVLDEYHVPDNR